MNSSQKTTVLSKNQFHNGLGALSMQMQVNCLVGKRASELSNLLVCNKEKKVGGYTESNYTVTVNVLYVGFVAVQITA